jgi:hypothetical protein
VQRPVAQSFDPCTSRKRSHTEDPGAKSTERFFHRGSPCGLSVLPVNSPASPHPCHAGCFSNNRRNSRRMVTSSSAVRIRVDRRVHLAKLGTTVICCGPSGRDSSIRTHRSIGRISPAGDHTANTRSRNLFDPLSSLLGLWKRSGLIPTRLVKRHRIQSGCVLCVSPNTKPSRPFSSTD